MASKVAFAALLALVLSKGHLAAVGAADIRKLSDGEGAAPEASLKARGTAFLDPINSCSSDAYCDNKVYTGTTTIQLNNKKTLNYRGKRIFHEECLAKERDDSCTIRGTKARCIAGKCAYKGAEPDGSIYYTANCGRCYGASGYGPTPTLDRAGEQALESGAVVRGELPVPAGGVPVTRGSVGDNPQG